MFGWAWAVVRARASPAALWAMARKGFEMNLMGETSTADGGSVNPLNQSITVLSADFQNRRLIAVGAAEGIGEEDGEGHAEPVAAEKCPCIAMFRAAFQGEDGSHAERAIRAGCNEPLQNSYQRGQEYYPKGYQGEAIVMKHDRVNQQTHAQGYQDTLRADQKRCEAEAMNSGF